MSLQISTTFMQKSIQYNCKLHYIYTEFKLTKYQGLSSTIMADIPTQTNDETSTTALAPSDGECNKKQRTGGARFGYTILYVDEVEKSLEFYEKAFSLTRGILTEDKAYGDLVTGETKVFSCVLHFLLFFVADSTLSIAVSFC